MPATMTTYGLYNYDPTLFDKLRVPQGIDKQTVINQIILDTWELELLYPTPNFLKAAIGFWSDTNQDIWQKLWDSEHFDYNPIWNVDGDVYEDGTAFKNRADYLYDAMFDNSSIKFRPDLINYDEPYMVAFEITK